MLALLDWIGLHCIALVDWIGLLALQSRMCNMNVLIRIVFYLTNLIIDIPFVDSASVVRIVNSSNTVNESGSFNMTCDASGYPTPNVHWITKHGERINGSILNFPNININDTGQYRCEVENECGNDRRVQYVEVYCKYLLLLSTLYYHKANKSVKIAVMEWKVKVVMGTFDLILYQL